MDDKYKDIIAQLRGLKCHYCGEICDEEITSGGFYFCSLKCRSTYLINLSFAGVQNLTSFVCMPNQLTKLDLSNLTPCNFIRSTITQLSP